MPAHQPEELPELFARGVNSGALDALVALYEPQACLEYPPGQVATGTQAIREALRGLLAMNPTLTLEAKTLNQTNGIALGSANWHLTATGPDGNPVDMKGQSVEVSRRQPDGTWRFLIDNPFGLGWDG
jgi:ketosteroid isomerase-like protein